MFPCCSLIPLVSFQSPTTFESTFLAVDTQYSSVRLCRSCNHIANKVSMSWCIKNNEISIWCLEKSCCNIDRHTTFLFFLRLVHTISEMKVSLIVFLCLLSISAKLFIRNMSCRVEYFTTKSTFTAIDMPNDYNIEVFAFLFSGLNWLSLKFILYFWVSFVEFCNINYHFFLFIHDFLFEHFSLMRALLFAHLLRDLFCFFLRFFCCNSLFNSFLLVYHFLVDFSFVFHLLSLLLELLNNCSTRIFLILVIC